MDGLTSMLLVGLIGSHAMIYYRLGKLEAEVKDLKGRVNKLNSR